MSSEIPMLAKYASKCSVCRHQINEKDVVWYHRGTKKARHAKCPEIKKEGKNG